MIVNHWENARINANGNHKGFLPVCEAPSTLKTTLTSQGRLNSQFAQNIAKRRIKQRVAQFRQDAIMNCFGRRLSSLL